MVALNAITRTTIDDSCGRYIIQCPDGMEHILEPAVRSLIARQDLPLSNALALLDSFYSAQKKQKKADAQQVYFL